MRIDEQWECWTLCAIKMKARTGGEKGRYLWPRLVQKIAESKSSHICVELERKSNGGKYIYILVYIYYLYCVNRHFWGTPTYCIFISIYVCTIFDFDYAWTCPETRQTRYLVFKSWNVTTSKEHLPHRTPTHTRSAARISIASVEELWITQV